MAVLRPDLMMKCAIPVVMAGIIGIVRHFHRHTLSAFTIHHVTMLTRAT